MAVGTVVAILRTTNETDSALATADVIFICGLEWFFPMIGSLLLGFLLKKPVVEKGPAGPLAEASAMVPWGLGGSVSTPVSLPVTDRI